MHAMQLDLLEDRLRPGCRALDVGSGSGYVSACMAHMVAPSSQEDSSPSDFPFSSNTSIDRSALSQGRVYGIEYVRELVPIAIDNIKKDSHTRPLLDSGIIQIQREFSH